MDPNFNLPRVWNEDEKRIHSQPHLYIKGLFGRLVKTFFFKQKKTTPNKIIPWTFQYTEILVGSPKKTPKPQTTKKCHVVMSATKTTPMKLEDHCTWPREHSSINRSSLTAMGGEQEITWKTKKILTTETNNSRRKKKKRESLKICKLKKTTKQDKHLSDKNGTVESTYNELWYSKYRPFTNDLPFSGIHLCYYKLAGYNKQNEPAGTTNSSFIGQISVSPEIFSSVRDDYRSAWAPC